MQVIPRYRWQTYKLHLLPSGIVRGGKRSVIGNGVVVDPWALLEEIARVREQGADITPETLMIAENATLILPVHPVLDEAMERARGNDPIGTTKRGIGPAYEDKIARRAIKVCDLRDTDLLKEKLEAAMLHHNALLRGLGAEEVSADEIYQKLMDVREEILSYAGVVWRELDEARKAGRNII